MCKISDHITFCTCEGASYDELPHYWVLSRFDKKKNLNYIGETMWPNSLYQTDFKENEKTICKRLNESDAFDKEMTFKEKDQLEVVINNLAEKERDTMHFCFLFTKGKWIEHGWDSFELMNHYNEIDKGTLEQIEGDKID